MLRVHWTKVCNGFDGTTREEDAEEALDAVAMKFPRISVNVVFQDEEEPPSYLLVYTHALVEDEESENGPRTGDIVVGTNTSEDADSLAVGRFGFGRFGDKEAELDTEAYLQTMFTLVKTDREYFLLEPKHMLSLRSLKCFKLSNNLKYIRYSSNSFPGCYETHSGQYNSFGI
jgi:hypothetical protein